MIVFLLMAVCLSGARAAFEDSGMSARAVSLAGAVTALTDDPYAAFSNPASLGFLRRAQLGASYLRQHQIPAGLVDRDHMTMVAASPLFRGPRSGSLAFLGSYDERNGQGVERVAAIAYGSRSFWEVEDGVVEVGGSLKLLKPSIGAAPPAGAKAALDVGVLARLKDRHAVGFSILNLNRPTFALAGVRDRAPATAKLGFAETVHGLVLSADISKREPSGGHRGTSELALGMEHGWSFARYGFLAARSGLNLGDRHRAWQWGLGFKRLGGSLDYAMTIPMSGNARVGHALSLVFRFGSADPDQEFQRVLAFEMRSRQALVEALGEGERRQERLEGELTRLRAEIEALRERLADKSASSAEAQDRLRVLQERHQQAVGHLRRMQDESRRLAEKTKQDLFDEDWVSYQKLKKGGGPHSLLTDQVKRILREYKDTGVDLSLPNQELLRLLRE